MADDINPEEETSSEESFNYTADDAEYGIIRLFYSDSTDGWSVIGGDFTLPAPSFEYTADDAEYGIGYFVSSDTSFVWTTHNVAATADTSRNIAVSEDVIAETKRKLAVSENINIDTVRHVVTTENIVEINKRT